MTLKHRLSADDYAKLGEADQKHYVQVGDHYEVSLDLDDGYQIHNPTALERALAKEKKGRKDAETELSALKTKVGDLDIDEARTAIDLVATYKGEGDAAAKLEEHKRAIEAKAQKRINDQKSQLVASHRTEVEARDEALRNAEAELARHLRTSEVRRLAGKEGNADLLDMAVEKVSRLAKDDSGRYYLSILNPETGEERIGPDGQPYSLERLMQNELRQGAFASLWNGHGIRGTGTPGGRLGGGEGGGPNPFAEETRNLTKQGELMRSDPARARQLAADAGVTLAEE